MEKKGFTGQLKYDFDTSNNLEIYLPESNYGWYRVTSREFRSFNGLRRINEIEYKGPLYRFNLNKRASKNRYAKNKFAGYTYKPFLRKGETTAY